MMSIPDGLVLLWRRLWRQLGIYARMSLGAYARIPQFVKKLIVATVVIASMVLAFRISSRMPGGVSADGILSFIGVFVAIYGVAAASYFAMLAIDAFAHVNKITELRNRFEAHVKDAEHSLQRLEKFDLVHEYQTPTLSSILSSLFAELSTAIPTKGSDIASSINWRSYQDRIQRLSDRQDFILAKDDIAKFSKARPLALLGSEGEVRMVIEFLDERALHFPNRSDRRDALKLLEIANWRVRMFELSSGFRSATTMEDRLRVAREVVESECLVEAHYKEVLDAVVPFLSALDNADARKLLVSARDKLQALQHA